MADCTIAAHAILITWTVIALFPVFVTVINSFKSRKAIFADPLALPSAANFDLIGYTTVLKQGDFFLYFQNSLIVTVASLFFVLLFGAMAAFALSEYRFKGNTLMGLYLALGIMIPIRIGTVAILQLMVATGLVNTLTALILVYTAQGLPLAVFAYGQEGLMAAIALFTASNLFHYTLGIKILSPKASLLQVLKTPLTLAMVLGLLSNATHIHLPEPIFEGLKLLGQAAIPMVFRLASSRAATGLRRCSPSCRAPPT